MSACLGHPDNTDFIYSQSFFIPQLEAMRLGDRIPKSTEYWHAL